MKARPISMANWFALAAPGLRAMPSTALAIALPCARPQRLDAIAIEKPALIGTQWPCTVLLPGVCANSPVLANIRIASTKSIFFVIRFSLDESLQEVVPGHRTAGLTLQSGIKPVLMFVRYCAAHIHHGEQHKNVRLHHADEYVQSHKNDGRPEFGEAQKDHRHLLTRQNIGTKTDRKRQNARQVTDDFDGEHQRSQPPQRPREMAQVSNAVYLQSLQIVIGEGGEGASGGHRSVHGG